MTTCCFSLLWEKAKIRAGALLSATRIADKSPLLFHYYLKTGGERWKSEKWKNSGFLQVIGFKNSLTYKTFICNGISDNTIDTKEYFFSKILLELECTQRPRSTEDWADHSVWFEEIEDHLEHHGLYLVFEHILKSSRCFNQEKCSTQYSLTF